MATQSPPTRNLSAELANLSGGTHLSPQVP